MNEEHVTDAGLRQFLLGNLNEVERQRIEKLFISDSNWKQRILIAEEDLIEDYLEGSLSENEQQQFLAQYGYTPRHLRRLQITRLIKDYAIAEADPPLTTCAQVPNRSPFFSKLWPLNLRILIPAVAVVLVAVIAGLIFLVQWERGKSNEAKRHAAIERELAELNSTDNSGQPSSHVLSLVLPPVSVRSASTSNEVKLNPDTNFIDLRLIWMQKEEYSSYRAVLHRVGDSEQYTISDLKLQSDKSGRAVIVRIDTQILRRGLYQIDISGIDNHATSGPGEEYTFTVNRW